MVCGGGLAPSPAVSMARSVAMPLVLVERDGPIAVVLLNRPEQLNALSDELMDELVTKLRDLDADEAIRCIVLGGSERAFAAGARNGGRPPRSGNGPLHPRPLASRRPASGSSPAQAARSG